MIICLILLLPAASSDPPENNPGQIIVLHSVLLRVRFTWHSLLPENRWALTPPFHPYWHKPAVYLCCTIFGVTSTGRYPASCPMKPGLSSPAVFRHLQLRPSVLLLHLCDFIIFFKTCKVLLSPDYIIQKISAVRRCRCKCITALILRMSIMSFYPNKRNLMRFFRL